MALTAYVKGRESAALVGKQKIIPATEELAIIERILTHLGLSA